MPASSETTLIVKFLDTVNTATLIKDFGWDLFVVEDVASYSKALSVASKRMAYPLDHPLYSIQDLFSLLRSKNIKLEFLFSRTTPEQLTDIIQQAANNLGEQQVPKYLLLRTYTYSNFFTYFKINCPTEEIARSIQESLVKDYVLTDPNDYLKRPLDCVYRPSPTVLATSLGCNPNTASRQEFWETVGIQDFWRTQDSELFTGQKVDVVIHEIEDNWASNSAFNYSIPAPPVDPDSHSAVHGCAVLGLLGAQWENNTLPDSFNTVHGIVPMVPVRLYSAAPINPNRPTELQEPDTLAQVIWQARNRPGDIILLEKELAKMPEYDVLNTINVGARGEFPLELDQVLFELMQVATHALQLLVIEPAGNGNCDLTKYEQELKQKDKQAKLNLNYSLNNVTPDVRSYIRRRLLKPYSRFIGYDLDNDSGAIMVGAAYWRNDKWQNVRPNVTFVDANNGDRVDTHGPSEQVLTTYPGTATGVICDTSAATAIVAGMIAALQVVCKHENSTLNVRQLRAILRRGRQQGLFELNELNRLLHPGRP